MFSKKPLSVAVHRALSGFAIASTAVAVPAWSQAQQPQEPLEEITVTGSRIATDPNLITSSPVTTVRAEDITQRGVTRVEDLINDLPQITPELSANESNGATGTATLDLRGLGSDRTLVLTNGHRMGFGDPFALAPDVNQVPGALVERIELLTGGASSTYGSDAMAGVVNFIMKDDFEGFQLDYQFSGYQHKNDNEAVQQQLTESGFEQAPGSPRDGASTSVNLILGVNTPDDRGNITAYVGYRDINAILQSSRDFSACALDTSDEGTTCAGSATMPEGLFTPFDGSFYYNVEGNEFVPWDGSYYNYGPLNHFQRPDERYTGGLFGHYDIDEHLTGYAEFQFMDDRSLAQIAPAGNFFGTSTLNCSNAFLSAQQFAAIGCTSEADVVPLYIGRRNVEGGPRFDDLRHTSFRMLGGLRGNITDNWSYDVSANFSRLIFSETYNNDMSVTRIGRSMDAVVDPGTGEIVCQSALDGVDPNCVPWNVFQEGGVTEEAIDYLTLPLFSKADLNMDQILAFVSGDLTDMGIASPWASAGVEMVFGVEYRDESFDFNPDQGFQSGDGAGQGGPVVEVTGSQNVREVFTEFRVPVAQDLPWVHSLSLDLRYRYSDYSTGVTADTYNIGGEWTPVEGIMLRGGFSRAVRAANIREQFEPQNLGLWSGTDPCAGAAPLLTEEQCANTGVIAGQYGTIPVSPAGQYNAIFGGNPDLEPEEGDTFTVGAVFTPDELVPGLTFSVDYWHGEVTDAIAEIEPEFLVRQCGLTADPDICALTQRGPNGNLWIGSNAFVTSTNVNIGFFEAAGYDVNATYSWEIGDWGGLDFNLRGTWLDQFDQQQVPGAPVDECAGFWGDVCGRPRPEWKHTFNTVWTTPWDLQLVGGWRYVGEVDEFEEDRFTAKGENYLDLSGTYVAQWFGEETSITAGVSNLLDNEPPVNGLFGNVSVFGNGNTIPATWDATGRYYFVGLSQRF
jgi:outer membrane receptor protein involved in Fe transport